MRPFHPDAVMPMVGNRLNLVKQENLPRPCRRPRNAPYPPPYQKESSTMQERTALYTMDPLQCTQDLGFLSSFFLSFRVASSPSLNRGTIW